jgi:hypothetical protein
MTSYLEMATVKEKAMYVLWFFETKFDTNLSPLCITTPYRLQESRHVSQFNDRMLAKFPAFDSEFHCLVSRVKLDRTCS